MRSALPLRSSKNCELLTKLSALLAIGAIVFSACSSDDGAGVVSDDLSSDTNKVRTVAVVAPLGDAATRTRLERTAQWFAENFKDEQQGDSFTVSLQLEWHDEQSEDLTALSKMLADRSDVTAVIGPFGNEAMAAFAPACQQTLKPLIAPTTTSEDIARRYAVSSAGKETNKHAFFWPLTETDVRFSETLLSCYITHLGNNIEQFHL